MPEPGALMRRICSPRTRETTVLRVTTRPSPTGHDNQPATAMFISEEFYARALSQ